MASCSAGRQKQSDSPVSAAQIRWSVRGEPLALAAELGEPSEAVVLHRDPLRCGFVTSISTPARRCALAVACGGALTTFAMLLHHRLACARLAGGRQQQGRRCFMCQCGRRLACGA